MTSDLDALIEGLKNRLHRMPTEDEVYTFIYGSQSERIVIWNS